MCCVFEIRDGTYVFCVEKVHNLSNGYREGNTNMGVKC